MENVEGETWVELSEGASKLSVVGVVAIALIARSFILMSMAILSISERFNFGWLSRPYRLR